MACMREAKYRPKENPGIAGRGKGNTKNSLISQNTRHGSNPQSQIIHKQYFNYAPAEIRTALIDSAVIAGLSILLVTSPLILIEVSQ